MRGTNFGQAGTTLFLNWDDRDNQIQYEAWLASYNILTGIGCFFVLLTVRSTTLTMVDTIGNVIVHFSLMPCSTPCSLR
jgi:predicted signal transduction protein with EAL and GGDEF domain